MISCLSISRRTLGLAGTLLFLLTAPAVSAQQVFFFKVFEPDTIGPGSVSTLAFEIFSSEAGPVTDLAFADTLPAGVTIANPPNASTTCAGAAVFVDAPAGGSTITFTGGELPPTPPEEEGVSCLVLVDVTSVTPGVHTNTSGDLTSNLGNHGDATADLTVATDRPGFTKSFAPNPITVGQTSTLTFTIDNTANGALAVVLSFSDPLPPGMEVASPANAATTCGGVLTATPGSTSVSFFNGSVAASSTCTVSVAVLATAAGSLGNTSGELTSGIFPAVSSGKAAAVLEVQLEALHKLFLDDPAPPGGTVTLRFTITNFDRNEAATDIAFTDDLDAALSGLVAAPPLPAEPCGPGSTLTGTSVLALSGGTLPPAGSCTFDVTLQVPADAAPGTHTNTTEPLTATVGGTPVTLNAASDDFTVSPQPILTKELTDDPVAPGSTVTLQFTVVNTSATSNATDIAFTDDLNATLPGLVGTGLPVSDPCGAGSELAAFDPPGPAPPNPSLLSFTGGDLAPAGTPGDSCTFQVTLQLPSGVPSGAYPNTTSVVTATVDGSPITGDAASDDLVVVAAPRLRKEFTDDPVQPGDTVTLQFSLTYDLEATEDATGIAFTDDLDAALAGLVAVPPLPADPCGPGSTLTGTAELTLTGGSLSPGETCTFSVTLQVPAGAPSGNHVNTTSTVQATVGGVATESPAASDLLSVAVLRLTKEFLDDPVLPGATVTLRFTVQNLSPSAGATDIQFVDDLDAALSGLAATGLPAAACGGTVSGTNTIVFAGGTLAAGESCAFDVVLQVPAGALSDTYLNSTAGFSATVESQTVLPPNATDTLTVDDSLLLFEKEFVDDPVAPGGTVTLRFTIENLSSDPATDLTFTDDLDDALSGLASVSGTLPDVCGAGSQLTGASLLTLTGGTLAAGASCTFDVTLQVPGSAALGTDALNTTSQVTGTVGGLGVTGGPASDTLQIDPLVFTKSFDGPTAATGNPILTFTITNLDTGSAISQVAFTDDLGAVLPGLVAVAPLPAAPCGAGSTLTGTSVLALSEGSLAAAGQPGDSCTFQVTLQVPADAAPGSFPNTTSPLSSAGLQVADPATDTLVVEPPPGFGKSFAPDSVGVGQTSTLTFTIVNTASAVAATDLDFTDALPVGVQVASPPAASTTCTGGTLTAVAGSGTVSYTGGAVAAGASCSVQVDVIATVPGDHLNTSGALTSSSGASGTASDILTASATPLFTKAFAPTEIELGGVSTLILTIDNSAGSAAATGLSFTDLLPAGMVVADPPNASTTCTGGTLTAVAGDGTVSYTGGAVAAGAVCVVMVDVTAVEAGDAVNVVELVSGLGPSGEATATLAVLASPADALEIPTAGTWGLLLLASMLAAGAVWRLRA